MTSTITTERVGKVAVLRLDRPPVNALSVGLLAELRQAGRKTRRRPARSGGDHRYGPYLFGRADITEFGGTGRAAEVARGISPVCSTPSPAFPRATVAVISGGAFGGGLELALACDFRFVASGARLGQPEILLGIIPGGGGTQRLARLVGPARAKDIVLTGRHLSAEEALAIGLVDRVVAADTLRTEAMEFASRLAAGAVVAQGLAKRAIDEGLGLSLADGLALERELFARVFATRDAGIGVRSFLESGPGKAEFVGA